MANNKPSLGEMLEVRQDVELHKQSQRKHPKGWEPHVEERGDTAVAVSVPMENPNPDEAELIRGWLLDPDEWEIVGNVNCRRWMTYDERWLYYYKADLRRKTRNNVDVSQILDIVRKRKPVKSVETTESQCSFLLTPTDFQIGKGDVDGSAGRVERTLASVDRAFDRFKELRRLGRPFDSIYMMFLGDLIESCDGHYAMQTFTSDLNLRDQHKVVRQLAFYAIDKFSSLGLPVVVGSVGGNHGTVRLNKEPYTDFNDNFDVACIEQVSEALAINPDRYGHVSFVFPKDDLSLSLDISGVPCGFIHGHQAKSGAGPQGKILNWWKNQAHGQTDVGSTRLLFAGHHHHHYMVNDGSKTLIGCAATDGYSDWWRIQTGQTSTPGITTMTIGADVHHAGWADLQIC